MKKNFINLSIILFSTLISSSNAYSQSLGGETAFGRDSGFRIYDPYDYTLIKIYLIALIAMFIGGKVAIYFFENFNFAKKITKKHIIIFYLACAIILIFFINIFFLLSTFLLALITSLVRNKFNLSKIFDEKFYYFIFGSIVSLPFFYLILYLI
jgi:hypothetical protein